MDQITYFIVGISLLLVIPLTYFCYNKIMSKKTKKSTSVFIAVIFFVFMGAVIFVATNAYAYLVNADDSVVSERYVLSLAENSVTGDYEKHLIDTKYFSYPQIEGLEDTFDQTAKLNIDDIQNTSVSLKRWTSDDGIVHQYMYLGEYDACFEIGLIQNGQFWDVATIELLNGTKKDMILTNEMFMKHK